MLLSEHKGKFTLFNDTFLFHKCDICLFPLLMKKFKKKKKHLKGNAAVGLWIEVFQFPSVWECHSSDINTQFFFCVTVLNNAAVPEQNASDSNQNDSSLCRKITHSKIHPARSVLVLLTVVNRKECMHPNYCC